MNNNTNVVVNSINRVLDHKFLNMVLFLITGVFMGYTLQPVPKWLNDTFNNSFIFKVVILIIIALLAQHKLESRSQILLIVAASVFVMVIFEMFRRQQEQESEKVVDNTEAPNVHETGRLDISEGDTDVSVQFR